MDIPRKKAVYLDEGSYNCIYTLENFDPLAVLRITVMPEPDEGITNRLKPGSRDYFQAERGDKDDDQFVMLYRARHMLTFLNRLIPAVGPSIVKEIGQTEVFSGSEAESMLKLRYQVQLCDKLRVVMRSYARPSGPGFYIMTQTMERLGDPWRGFSAEEIFSLLWFLATAQRSVQFQHHDLKPKNLLTRNYSNNQTFIFGLRFKAFRRTWTITTNTVPVVIDLDFATVHNSLFNQDRHRVGTWAYAPPDAICRDYLSDLDGFNRDDFVYSSLGFESRESWNELFAFGDTDEDGYDMWSVGMILLENLVPVRIRQLRALLEPIAQVYQTFVERKVQRYGWDLPDADVLQYVLINAVISCAILQDDNQPLALPLFNQSADYGFRYSFLLFNNEFFAAGFANPDVQSFRQEFRQSSIFDQYRVLIRRLMDWDPVNRGSQGAILEELSRPGEMFHSFLVQDTGGGRAATERFIYEEVIMENKKKPLLTPEVMKHLQTSMDSNSSYCCAQCLSREAVVQCGNDCGAAFYCGQQCANDHYVSHELQCIEAKARGKKGFPQGKVHKVLDEFKHGKLHSGSKHGPVVTNRKQAIAIALAEARRKKVGLELVGHKPGDPATTPGMVMVSGNFVMIRLLELNGDAAFQVARSYVNDNKLGWTVRQPHAWTDYQTGPHVTLSSDMKKYAGEIVDVQLGSLFHFEDGPSRWVAFHATLPSKFKCPFGCHVSVAQQRVK